MKAEGKVRSPGSKARDPKDGGKKRQSGLVSLKLVFEFWKERKGLALALVAGTAVTTGISLAFPYILRFIIDGIRPGGSQPQLLRYVLILTGFGFLRSIAEALLPWARGRVNERYQWIVRARVFRRLLDMGHSFTNRFPTGDAMERLDHDLGELSWFACSGIFRSVSAFFSIVFALVFMLSMNTVLTAVTVVPMAAAAVVWMRLGPLVYARYMEWRKRIAEINNLLESSFTGIRLVKSYVMEGRLGSRFRGKLDGRVRAAVNTARVDSRISVFYMAALEVGVLLVLWLGGVLVVDGRLTLGEFVAFNGYVLMLIGPMFDIGNLFVSGRRAQAGSERVGEMEQHRPEVSQPARPLVPRPGSLRLENVTFAYDTRPALREVTMDFPPGRRIGIAGTVGSGKSTVFRLLFRLADPQQGRVTLGGVDVRDLDLDEYRGRFGHAPQEATLFSDTLRENIRFGREAGDEELGPLISLAQLGEDIKGFTKGLDEKLGERGARLSGGQKERVAIARALLNRPPILVFDDATSALDAETERALVGRLTGELGGATAIVVSHRLSVLSSCDWIYVLDGGEVKEQGTHTELLAREGLYWKLYERQLIQEELERL